MLPSIVEQFLGEGMENVGAIALDAQNGQANPMDTSLRRTSDSEVRRFLFEAAHHGKQREGTLGNFPGKFAWIAVVLFVLSMLIAFAG